MTWRRIMPVRMIQCKCPRHLDVIESKSPAIDKVIGKLRYPVPDLFERVRIVHSAERKIPIRIKAAKRTHGRRQYRFMQLPEALKSGPLLPVFLGIKIARRAACTGPEHGRKLRKRHDVGA